MPSRLRSFGRGAGAAVGHAGAAGASRVRASLAGAAVFATVALATAVWAQPPADARPTDAPPTDAPRAADGPAATPAGDDEPSRQGALRAAISLVEVRLDNGGREAPLPFGDLPQDVDINSIVRVVVQPHRLANALGAGEAGAPAELALPSQQIRDLIAASQALRDAAPLMQQAFDNATRLVDLAAQGQRDSQQFAELAAQAQAQFGALSTSAAAYRTALQNSAAPDLQRRAVEFEAARNAAIQAATDPSTPAAGKSAILAALLMNEADWIVAELQRRGEEAAHRLRGVALVLFAVSMRSGEPAPIHLEHYDTLPQGVPVPYEKIRAVPSPEDEAELRAIFAEAQSWAGLFTDLRARRASLGQSLRAAARQAGLDTQPLLAALRQARSALEQITATEWEEAARALADSVRQQLATGAPTAAVRARLQALRAKADALAARAQAAGAAALATGEALRTLTSTAFLDDLAAAPSSVDGLVLVLRAVDERARLLADGLRQLQQLPQVAQSLAQAVGEVAEAAREVTAAAEQLPAAVRASLATALSQVVAARTGPVRDAVQQVGVEAAALAARAASLLDLDGPAVEAYAAADFEAPDTSFAVSGARLQDTYLDLRTLADRREGDTVAIVAKLYRVREVEAVVGGVGGDGAGGEESPAGSEDGPAGEARLASGVLGEELDSQAQTLRMLRFGWFTAPGGGPAYVVSSFRREADGPRIRQFAPMVAWMLRRQGWPAVGDGARPQRAGGPWILGVGIHTVVLDLNGDNQQEIGVGAAVSVFRDLLQFGYGWDVGLHDRLYWYVGVRVVGLGKGMGVERVGGG